MEEILREVKSKVFNGVDVKLTDVVVEAESKEYNACRFSLKGKRIISRTSKITPKKKGQFVTFYQRNKSGVIEPLHELDHLDYFLVTIRNNKGFFLLPKQVLIEKGILSTLEKEGKRAFRVYMPSDELTSKQALATQKWQSDYFYEINK